MKNVMILSSEEGLIALKTSATGEDSPELYWGISSKIRASDLFEKQFKLG